jgi:hypothetical protein
MMLDTQLGRILDALQANPGVASQTVLMLLADHGGQGTGHFEEAVVAINTIPFCLWGAGIPAGVDAYTLFSNRADPGAARPAFSDTSVMQPLHNADAANLAVTLLGLPLIPDAPIIPILGAKTAAAPALTIAQSQNSLTISWPADTAGYELQSSTTLGVMASWQTVSGGITTDGNQQILTIVPSAADPVRYFRLHKP